MSLRTSADVEAASGVCSLKSRSKDLRKIGAIAFNFSAAGLSIRSTNRSRPVVKSGSRLRQTIGGMSSVAAALFERFDQDRDRVEPFDLAHGDRRLETNVGGRIGGKLSEHVLDRSIHFSHVPRRANAPGAQGRVGILKEAAMKIGLKRSRADQGPERIQSLRSFGLFIENDRFQEIARLRRISFLEQSARGVALVTVGAAEKGNERVVAFFSQVASLGSLGFRQRSNAVETSFQTIDSGGVAIGVLIAVIAIIPIKNVKRTVGTDFERDRHEPGVVRGQEIVVFAGAIGRAAPFERIDVDAIAVDVSHEHPTAPALGKRGAVEVQDAAIRRFLMAVIDDRFDDPGERRIRPALAVIIAGFGQVPEMVDHAGAA